VFQLAWGVLATWRFVASSQSPTARAGGATRGYRVRMGVGLRLTPPGLVRKRRLELQGLRQPERRRSPCHAGRQLQLQRRRPESGRELSRNSRCTLARRAALRLVPHPENSFPVSTAPDDDGCVGSSVTYAPVRALVPPCPRRPAPDDDGCVGSSVTYAPVRALVPPCPRRLGVRRKPGTNFRSVGLAAACRFRPPCRPALPRPALLSGIVCP
jgi:hypothetical protein